MRLSVLVPYRPSPARRPLAELALARLAAAVPVGSEVWALDDLGANDDLFNHGQAINRAAARATGDVLLIADADTTFDHPGRLLDAVRATGEDRRWRLPGTYRMLTERATARLLSDAVPGLEYLEPGDPLPAASVPPSPLEVADEDCEWVGRALSWSGLIVVPREAFDLVGGCDERYVGWGADDVALARSLETLWGPVERWPGDAIHLWHPRGHQEKGWHRHSVEQRELTERYDRAAGDPDAMRALVDERVRIRA